MMGAASAAPIYVGIAHGAGKACHSHDAPPLVRNAGRGLENPGLGRRASGVDIEKKRDGGKRRNGDQRSAQSQNNHCPFPLTASSVHTLNYARELACSLRSVGFS